MEKQLKDVIKNIVKPDKLIGLSTMGVQHTVEEVVSKNIAKNNNSHCAFNILYYIPNIYRIKDNKKSK